MIIESLKGFSILKIPTKTHIGDVPFQLHYITAKFNEEKLERVSKLIIYTK